MRPRLARCHCGPGQYIASMAIKPDRVRHQGRGHDVLRDRYDVWAGEGSEDVPSLDAREARHYGFLPLSRPAEVRPAPMPLGRMLVVSFAKTSSGLAWRASVFF